jgi:hypothetical protein
MIERAFYPHKRIASLSSLALALFENEQGLTRLAAGAGEMYFPGKLIPKKDGSLRETFDTRPQLKRVLVRTNNVFLTRVVYPKYLHGSLRKRDPKSNAEVHVGALVVTRLDIKSFFPSITARHVNSIWMNVFRFAPTVCEILTDLTCCDGALIQGAPTSSYLANLVLWDVEPIVVQKLAERGFRYTRYVDDISVSANRNVRKDDMAWAISQIYAMLGSHGFKANRRKEEILRPNEPIILLGLVANRKVSLSGAKRNEIRAEVDRHTCLRPSESQTTRLKSTLGKVHHLRRFHPKEGSSLLSQLKHE